MAKVSFSCSIEDAVLIREIIKRAFTEPFPIVLDEDVKRDLSMDITATHANGCPLDLKKLLSFDEFNFLHDLTGIQRHLNRRTGKLEDHFVPRCAARPTDGRANDAFAEGYMAKKRRYWPDHPLVGRVVAYKRDGISTPVEIVDVKAGPMLLDTSTLNQPEAKIDGTIQLRLRHTNSDAEFWSPPMIWDGKPDDTKRIDATGMTDA